MRKSVEYNSHCLHRQDINLGRYMLQSVPQMDTEALGDYTLKKLGLTSGNLQSLVQRQNTLRPQRCGMCGGDHSTYQCNAYPMQNTQQPRANKWCSNCRKYTNHEVADCYCRPRYQDNQNYNTQNPGVQFALPPLPRYQCGPVHATPVGEKP